MEYRLKDGRIAFVRSGIGPDAFKAFSKAPNPNKKEGFDTPHGIRTLPWRETFEEAQADLDQAVKEQKGIFNGSFLSPDQKSKSYEIGKPFFIQELNEYFVCEEEEGTPSCKNCALDNTVYCNVIECFSENRKDKKSVIIKKATISKNDNKKDKNETVNNKTKVIKEDIIEINPEDLTVLPILQTRVAMNEEAIEDYCNLIRSGMHYKFPPLEAVRDIKDENVYYLYDGFHRLEAFKRVADEGDFQSVYVKLKPGTLEDALWYAIAANQEHGIRRTNEDKRNAVLKALEHPRGKELSDRALADWVGVSAPTVSAIRNSGVKLLHLNSKKTEDEDFRCGNSAPETTYRIGKDGKKYPAKQTRTNSEPSFSTPPESIKKPSIPEDWFAKPSQEFTTEEKEKYCNDLQNKINEIYKWLEENKLVTEYDHQEDRNLTLFKGISFIGTITIPFIPPHKMPEPD